MKEANLIEKIHITERVTIFEESEDGRTVPKEVGVFEFKLQLGCLLLVLYFISAYLRETIGKNRKRNIYFTVLLYAAPLAIIFDGATAWTVNRLDTVPAWLNLLLHALFYLSVDAVIVFDYLYIIDKSVGIRSKKHLVLVLIPSVIFFIGILAFLPQVEYLKGNGTNYSMGWSPIFCFASLTVHFLLILILLMAHYRSIERVRLFDLVVFIIMVFIVLFAQIMIPELLISALLPTFSLIVLYMTFENPSYSKLEHYNREMVTAFATLVENRDNSTGGHIRRTQGYVEIILQQLKNKPEYRKTLTKDYINSVINAAPLHDIGKIATPDSILQKPGKLTVEEFESMKNHAKQGGLIIQDTFASIDEPKNQQIAYEVATYHHEKWNGTGYPEGLAGEEIPLHARIMAVADVFDAISSQRCYREAMPLEECFAIIEEGSGQHFDPEIVKAFMDARTKVEKFYQQQI